MQKTNHNSPFRLVAIVGVALTALHLFTVQTMAQITNPVLGNIGTDDAAAESGATFARLFVYFWNVVIIVGGIVVLVNFIQAALEWITAGGDSGKLTKARDKMLQSFIGLAILVFSFVLINFVGDILFGNQFELLQFRLPSPG